MSEPFTLHPEVGMNRITEYATRSCMLLEEVWVAVFTSQAPPRGRKSLSSARSHMVERERQWVEVVYSTEKLLK